MENFKLDGLHGLDRSIGLAVWMFATGPEDRGSIPGWVIPKIQKMVLDTSLLNCIIRYGSRVKWSNPGKGVMPFPTPWCSSYWKGGLLVLLGYGRQLTHTHTHTHIYIYIYIYIYKSNIYQHSRYQKKKEKKNRQEQEIKISRITARGKKKKYYGTKRKKRPTSSHPFKKIKRFAVSWSKEN